MKEQLLLILPELILATGALLLLGVDLIESAMKRALSFGLGVLVFVGGIVSLILASHWGVAWGMLTVDPLGQFFKFLAMIAGILVLFISRRDKNLFGDFSGSYVALLIFSVLGTMLLASASDWLILFIGMELTSIPLFILAGLARMELRSSESAMKFFLVGAFSAGCLLFGISYFYVLTGSTQFLALNEWLVVFASTSNFALFLIGLFFVLAGLGFKFSLVPFHQWTPDIYEGAPTPVTAFFTVSRDAGVVVVFLRLFGDFMPHAALGLTPILAVLSILTMTVGNLTALRQNNLKRLLAYSSIAHAGTIFIGIVAGSALGRQGVMVYSFAYFFMSLGAFAVVAYLGRLRGSDQIEVLKGLGKENFALALLFAVFILSLAGIPPFLGFWGKFYVFAAAIEAKMYLLVFIGLLNAVVSVFYYFRILHAMFFEDRVAEMAAVPNPLDDRYLEIAVFFSSSLLLFLGIFPEAILSWVKLSSRFLP